MEDGRNKVPYWVKNQARFVRMPDRFATGRGCSTSRPRNLPGAFRAQFVAALQLPADKWYFRRDI